MLGKFAHEVEEQLTIEDINNWIAYSNIRDKQHKKDVKVHKAKNPKKG